LVHWLATYDEGSHEAGDLALKYVAKKTYSETIFVGKLTLEGYMTVDVLVFWGTFHFKLLPDFLINILIREE